MNSTDTPNTCLISPLWCLTGEKYVRNPKLHFFLIQNYILDCSPPPMGSSQLPSSPLVPTSFHLWRNPCHRSLTHKPHSDLVLCLQGGCLLLPLPFCLAQAVGCLTRTMAWASSLVFLPPSSPSDRLLSTKHTILLHHVWWAEWPPQKRCVYAFRPSLCEYKLLPLNPTASVLRRHR